ncbi:DEAD/DEAH box helicase family protein, partial [Luminiphilus sp.]|nr:DEAD/DEAH box helicase family protein [Luminiphilus sp.]
MWQYWSISELQSEIGELQLEFLEGVVSALSPEEGTTFLGAKSKLAALVGSLQDHTYFRNRKNLEWCLSKVPADKLATLVAKCELTASTGDLAGLAKEIQSKNKSFESFINFFGLPERFLATESVLPPVTQVNRSASVDFPKKISKPYKTLKDYQIKCVLESARFLDVPSGRMLLQMPTGSGKTRTAMEIIAEEMNKPQRVQVVWLANTRELCEQAVQCFTEIWDHVGRRDCVINRMWGAGANKVSNWSDSDCVFSVVGFQSAWSLYSKKEDYFNSLFS